MQESKHILLIGSSYSALPLLEFLKNEGYKVSVCGGLEKDPCHSYADESFFIDYSNKEALLKLCKEENFDYIVPTCNDYSYNSASYVATKLAKYYGFDDYNTTKLLHTKGAFRKFTLENDLPVPQAIKVIPNSTYDISNMSFPLLIKPDDSFSGKGITKVMQIAKLEEAIKIAQHASKNNEAVVEEFVEGTLHSHSAFIQDGEILIDFFVDEFCTVYPYQVDSSSLSTSLDKKIRDAIQESIQKLIRLLNLKDGLLHTQIITDGKEFWLIEPMRRCPGDLYGSLIEKSTNLNYTKLYVEPFLNKKSTIKKRLKNKFIARHTISSKSTIIYKSFSENIPSKNINIFTLKESAQVLRKAPFDKLGIIFAEFESENELREHTPNMKNFIIIDNIKEINIDF